VLYSAAVRPLPVAAGKSPFRVKGNAYRGYFDFCAERVPGGLEALLARIPDADLVSYLRGSFLSASWYDVLPLVALGEVAAEALGQSASEFMAAQARAQAERDINGIYRLLLKMATPEMIMTRLPKVAAQYFDFVTAEVEKLGAGHWKSTGSGILEFAIDSYRATTEAFLRRALETAGAKKLQHRWHPPVSQGERAGLAVVRVTREMSWEP
jgi:hypothetical protein